MSGGDDWQVGDLALCITHGPDPVDWNSGLGGPALGSINLVTKVMGAWLALDGFDDSDYYALAFRKIRPHAPDAEDAETIRLLNSAPVKEPAA